MKRTQWSGSEPPVEMYYFPGLWVQGDMGESNTGDSRESTCAACDKESP